MTKFPAAITFVAVVAAILPASAADTMHGPTKAPTCAAGDPAVTVDAKNKTYTIAEEHGKTSQAHGGTKMNKDESMTHNDGMASGHTSMTCKSKADAMGAEMKGL